MILLATEAILFMPPIIIIHSKTPKNNPVNSFGTLNSLFITRAILLICGIFPDPIAVIIIKKANKTATHFMFKPCSM